MPSGNNDCLIVLRAGAPRIVIDEVPARDDGGHSYSRWRVRVGRRVISKHDLRCFAWEAAQRALTDYPTKGVV